MFRTACPAEVGAACVVGAAEVREAVPPAFWRASVNVVVNIEEGAEANILDPNYRDAGVGVARGYPFGAAAGAATYTVDFGARAE